MAFTLNQKQYREAMRDASTDKDRLTIQRAYERHVHRRYLRTRKDTDYRAYSKARKKTRELWQNTR